MTVSETAIEVAAKRVYEDKGDRKGIVYVGWNNEPDDIKERWREDVRVSVEAYLTAALSDQAGGWQLVPNEPTEEMLIAGVVANQSRMVGDVYRAMIAAAPPPSSTAGEG